MLVMGESEQSLSKKPIVRFLSRRMRGSAELHGSHFFVRKPDPETGKLARFATPLFLALVVINIADLVFAVDSVPAIFAITTDTYIVRSEEHTSELQSLMRNSYAVFCLKKK